MLISPDLNIEVKIMVMYSGPSFMYNVILLCTKLNESLKAIKFVVIINFTLNLVVFHQGVEDDTHFANDLK